MKDKHDKRLREHGDMAAILRKAQEEIREHKRLQDRKAEVDAREGTAQDEILDVPVLLVEDSSGVWTAGTTTQVFPSMAQALQARDRDERVALVELRFKLREALVTDRYVRTPERARRLAALANLWSAGRVPYSRIVSR